MLSVHLICDFILENGETYRVQIVSGNHNDYRFLPTYGHRPCLGHGLDDEVG